MRKLIGISLVILSIAIVIGVLYLNSGFNNRTQSFSPYTLLSSSWEKYKTQFINQDGRVIDPSQNNITTSEGQSYALLRAVWSDDQPTFDRVWKWTKQNLKRPSDNLFGWKWGKNDNQQYGFISGGGDNSASDADNDIAFALIQASKRWSQNSYSQEAKNILKDIWNIDTATAGDKRFLIAGNWAKIGDDLIINPSYFSPYEWRIFAQIDTEHDWNSLVDPAYELLNISGRHQLDKSKGVGLPPDWVAVNTKTGDIYKPNIDGLTTNYSFDAMRTPWRIALDYQWNNNQEAKNYLENSYGYLTEIYQHDATLMSSYAHDGTPLTQIENPAMYATALGYFTVVHPDIAKKIYEDKIIKLYSNDTNSFNKDLPYYEQNWLWFGVGLYNKQLIRY